MEEGLFDGTADGKAQLWQEVNAKVSESTKPVL